MYYQPMFPPEITLSVHDLYENDYVKDHSIDWQSGVGSIFHSVGDRFRWLDSEGAHSPAGSCHYGAENKMVLSVISALKYLNTCVGPDYSYRTLADRKMIDVRLKASLTELGAVAQIIRRSPNRPWVSGPE
jgi:hypothetical protein